MNLETSEVWGERAAAMWILSDSSGPDIPFLDLCTSQQSINNNRMIHSLSNWCREVSAADSVGNCRARSSTCVQCIYKHRLVRRAQ